MKKIHSLLAAVLATTVAVAQPSTLPGGWNFDDPQPVGWVESLDQNPGNTRYTNGYDGAACRLDADDEYVSVFFSDVCGEVTYYIKGQGTATNDVFTVQESVDGTTWTTLRELNQADIDAASSSFVEYTDVPNATSRYIRWYFTEKQSGRNIALDEITLTPQIPTNAAEISVSSNATEITNESQFVVGNQASVPITIENMNLAGGDTLHITDIILTQPASDYSISGVSLPTFVEANSSITFTLNFTAGAPGTRTGTLTILNNDANGDETTFNVSLYGVGGDYATEPTAAPTNLQFSNVTTYGYEVSFDDATTIPENYIVVRGIENQFLAQPADGETYVKGDYIDAFTQVVYVGPAGSFKPSYNVANTSYFFAAYAFNGPAGFENYYTVPLEGSVTTPQTMMGTYYAGLDASQSNFLTELQSRISQNYHQIYYSNYAPTLINNFAARDTTGGQKVVTGVYSGYKHIYTGAFFWDVLSREHSWPHSWMPTFPSQDGMEYSDMHNLFPTHQDNANAVRSNRPLGNVESNASTFLSATYGDDANGNRVYEPRDEHKGDAARAIFYMATKWNGTGGSWELPNPIDFIVQYGQDQDVLKQWHWQDPPSKWEIARNDFIESEQGNRNPFIDSVNWVCYIDFETMTYIGEQTAPCTVTPSGIKEQLAGNFSVVPNPSNGLITLNLNLQETQDLTIEIMDVAGRQISTQSGSFNTGVSKQKFDLSHLDAGVYHMVLKGEKGSAALKVVLQ